MQETDMMQMTLNSVFTTCLIPHKLTRAKKTRRQYLGVEHRFVIACDSEAWPRSQWSELLRQSIIDDEIWQAVEPYGPFFLLQLLVFPQLICADQVVCACAGACVGVCVCAPVPASVCHRLCPRALLPATFRPSIC